VKKVSLFNDFCNSSPIFYIECIMWSFFYRRCKDTNIILNGKTICSKMITSPRDLQSTWFYSPYCFSLRDNIYCLYASLA
jgi:hypothetical protein